MNNRFRWLILGVAVAVSSPCGAADGLVDFFKKCGGGLVLAGGMAKHVLVEARLRSPWTQYFRGAHTLFLENRPAPRLLTSVCGKLTMEQGNLSYCYYVEKEGLLDALEMVTVGLAPLTHPSRSFSAGGERLPETTVSEWKIAAGTAVVHLEVAGGQDPVRARTALLGMLTRLLPGATRLQIKIARPPDQRDNADYASSLRENGGSDTQVSEVLMNLPECQAARIVGFRGVSPSRSRILRGGDEGPDEYFLFMWRLGEG